MRLTTLVLIVTLLAVYSPLAARFLMDAQVESIPIEDRILLKPADAPDVVQRAVEQIERQLDEVEAEANSPELAKIMAELSALIRRYPGLVVLYRLRFRARQMYHGGRAPFLLNGEEEFLRRIRLMPYGRSY